MSAVTITVLRLTSASLSKIWPYAGKAGVSQRTMVIYNHSENRMSAANQQERREIESWITGFTDGEGCFSVSLIKNRTTKLGWQVFPEFVVTQGEKSLTALELIKNYFGCGKIFINRRHDNHNENLYRFCVRSFVDLDSKIVPFFKKNKLRTAKSNDFLIFVEILKKMKKKVHFKQEGMKSIAILIQKMNKRKISRFLESSETKRQTRQ